MKKSNKPCKCGHYQNVHLPVILRDQVPWNPAICMYCFDMKQEHEFELDNLSLIEETAEKKGLIKKKKVKQGKPWHWPFQRMSDGPEYSCPHGVGHSKGMHGCDGCCRDKNFPV